MKKIIDGKRYDTETADEIAHYDNGYPDGEFKWYEETLYRTQKGKYFVFGEGGAMTGYSQPVGDNGRGGGSGWRVLSHGEALSWLEKYGFTEEIETHFADSVEDA